MMMTVILISALMFRPSRAAFAVVSMTVLSNVLIDDLSGKYYYLCAAIMDLVILHVLARLETSLTGVRLSTLCVVSIFLNAFGALCWWLYYPPYLYDKSFNSLYVIMAIIIVMGNDADVVGLRRKVRHVLNVRRYFSSRGDVTKTGDISI